MLLNNAEFAILTTTINIPIFLKNICENIKKFKHKNIFFLVLADRKTPIEAKSYCKKISKKFKIKIIYLDIEKQDLYFKKKYKNLYSLIPYNDNMRRLLGLIYIKKFNPKRVIFIDDDNFVSNKVDFLKGHSIVSTKVSGKSIYIKSRWPNIYRYLQTENNLPIFPRGFPWSKRDIKNFKFKFKKVKNKLVLANCGFILGDPDIDAISRLFWKIKVKKIISKGNKLIGKNMFCPFNDQNTCIDGKTSLLYFKPVSAGRNSDIWTSYLYNKISSLHDSLISYGMPHLTQIRNKHDIWKDFELEKLHNIYSDHFVQLLMNVKVNKCKTYYETLKLLVKKLEINTNKKIKKIVIPKKDTNRHYQSMGKKETLIRELKSLKYIKKYLVEYSLWLKWIKYYNLIK